MRESEQDAVWVVEAQCGDRDAMEHLLRRVQMPLRRYIVRLVGSTAADDVLKEALTSIARKLTWLSTHAFFARGAYRVASRSAFAHLRKEQRRRRPSGDQLREPLDSAIVSPASRAVLMLHFQEEMPLADVAAMPTDRRQTRTSESGFRSLSSCKYCVATFKYFAVVSRFVSPRHAETACNDHPASSVREPASWRRS